MSRPTIVIDALGIASEDDFWNRYLRTTKPEGAGYFGCNLDAFWDAVEGGGPGYPGEINLHFTNMSALSALPNGKRFMEAFAEIASDSKYTTITWEA